MVQGASIQGCKLQTDGAEGFKAACCLDHPLQRRIRVWLLQPNAQWACDSTLSVLRSREGAEAEELVMA